MNIVPEESFNIIYVECCQRFERINFLLLPLISIQFILGNGYYKININSWYHERNCAWHSWVTIGFIYCEYLVFLIIFFNLKFQCTIEFFRHSLLRMDCIQGHSLVCVHLDWLIRDNATILYFFNQYIWERRIVRMMCGYSKYFMNKLNMNIIQL